MQIDLRNLDLVKDLLTVINDEIKDNSVYYRQLYLKLKKVMDKYEERVNEDKD